MTLNLGSEQSTSIVTYYTIQKSKTPSVYHLKSTKLPKLGNRYWIIDIGYRI